MQSCEQRFLTCIALSVYEVVGVACQSHSDKRLTDDLNEFLNAMQDRNLRSQGMMMQKALLNRSTGYYKRVSNNALQYNHSDDNFLAIS